MNIYCVNEGMIRETDQFGKCSVCQSDSIIPEELLPEDDKELEMSINNLKGRINAKEEICDSEN